MEIAVKTEPGTSQESCDANGANYEHQGDANFVDDFGDPEWSTPRSTMFGIDETRHLLKIWGEKSIQDDLRTTKHNRAIYERVRKRMAALGYNRTVKQLHDKCKNLSVDYRKARSLKNAGRDVPGTGRAILKFYNEMDRILGQRDTASSGAEENIAEDDSHSSSSLTENETLSYTLPGTHCARAADGRFTHVPYMHDPTKSPGAPRPIWSDTETLALINIWGTDKFQSLLKSVHHKKPIFKEIQGMMNAQGYMRTAKQLKDKCKNLLVEYRRAWRSGTDDASRRSMFKFYDKFHSIMGHETDSSASGLEESQTSAPEMEDLGDDSPGLPYPISVTTVVRNMEEAEQPSPQGSSEDYSPCPVSAHIGVSSDDASLSNPAQSHRAPWLNSETKALLEIWGHKNIQEDIRRTRHNKVIFKKIQGKMQERGFSRTVSQLQAKCKSLAKEYRKAKRNSVDDEGRRLICRFYDELDSILSGYDNRSVESVTDSQTKRPLCDTLSTEEGNGPFQPSLPNGNLTAMNGTGVKRARMEDSESESDGGNCEMISPRPKTSTARIIPGRRFFSLKAAGCVFQSEHWQPRGETVYQPLQHEVLINATNIEQISFSEGLAFVGNQAGAYVSTESGHMIHLWRHDNQERKLYVSRTFLFTNYQMYSEVREVLEQL
ncbi:uncharacterized protein LOC144903888 isoform X1 [Branchiostoma floridae x Branchiostoma belcheri]